MKDYIIAKRSKGTAQRAVIRIYDMPAVTKEEKKRLIKWLREAADEIAQVTDNQVWVKNPRWTLFKRHV